MTTIRVSHNRENPYVVINKYGLRHKPLKLAPRGLWSHMLSFPDDWEFNIPKLCNDMDVGKTAIYSAMDVLIKEGFMLRLQYNGKTSTGERGFQDVEYMVFEFPITPEDKLVIEDEFQRKFTLSGFPLPDNPLPENPPLLSNEDNQVKKETTTPLLSSSEKIEPLHPPEVKQTQESLPLFHSTRKYLKDLSDSDVRQVQLCFEKSKSVIDNPVGWITRCVQEGWYKETIVTDGDLQKNFILASKVENNFNKMGYSAGAGFTFFSAYAEGIAFRKGGKEIPMPSYRLPAERFKEIISHKLLVECKYPDKIFS